MSQDFCFCGSCGGKDKPDLFDQSAKADVIKSSWYAALPSDWLKQTGILVMHAYKDDKNARSAISCAERMPRPPNFTGNEDCSQQLVVNDMFKIFSKALDITKSYCVASWRIGLDANRCQLILNTLTRRTFTPVCKRCFIE